jgi:hypothetical protein
MAKTAGPNTISVNPMFKLLLWINAALCVATLGVMVWLTTFPDAIPKAPERLFNACEHVFTLTAGASSACWAAGPLYQNPKTNELKQVAVVDMRLS